MGSFGSNELLLHGMPQLEAAFDALAFTGVNLRAPQNSPTIYMKGGATKPKTAIADGLNLLKINPDVPDDRRISAAWLLEILQGQDGVED